MLLSRAIALMCVILTSVIHLIVYRYLSFFQKLVAYSISGNCIEWLKTFLRNRTMCRKFNHVFSDYITQLNGTPEDSVFGSLCFVILINDISKYINYCKINFMLMILICISRFNSN